MRMFRLAGAMLAVVLSCAASTAKDLTLPVRDPMVSMAIPDSWSVSSIRRGLEIKSPDQGIFLWFEVVGPGETDKVSAEHVAYFKNQGVVVTGPSASSKVSEDGVTILFTNLPAAWNGKPTILRYVDFDLGLPSGRRLLGAYWASPEADAKYDAAMNGLMKSIARLPGAK